MVLLFFVRNRNAKFKIQDIKFTATYKMFISQYVIAFCVVAVVGTPDEDGKWHPYKYGNNGK